MSRSDRFTFDDFEIDEATWQLRRRGRRIPVQPKVFALLLHLIRHRHRVVSRVELTRALWPDVTVTDGSLMRLVSLARFALGERASEARIIRTHHRTGYRFCAPVRVGTTGPGANPDGPALPTANGTACAQLPGNTWEPVWHRNW